MNLLFIPTYDVIVGGMTGCPGYIGITINNRHNMEELFRYDVLVFCPQTFNISFKVPNWGQDPDKTFDIRLDDAHTTYSIYLTHMVFEQDRLERSARVAGRHDIQTDTWTTMVVIISVVLVVSGVALLTYVYLEFTKLKGEYCNQQDYADVNRGEPQSSQKQCFGTQNLNHNQVVFLILYGLIRLLYSLVFTFTVFSSVLLIFIRSDMSQINNVTVFQMSKHNASRARASDIGRHGQDELYRQSELVTSMQGACSNYIEELFTSMQNQMTNVTMAGRQQEMYGNDTSISYLMSERFSRYIQQFEDDIANFTESYQEGLKHHLDPKWTRYKKYMKRIYDNQFFQFSQMLFNQSHFSTQRPHAFQRSDFIGKEIDFVAFMEVEEVEAVQLWTIQFWQRLVLLGLFYY